VVHAALGESLEAPHHEMIEDVLHAAGVPIRRQVKVRRAMLRSALTRASISSCWYLWRPASAPARALARQARLPQRLVALLGVHTV
jgi:hypothetical protein